MTVTIRDLALRLNQLIEDSNKLNSVNQYGGTIRLRFDGKFYDVNALKRKERTRTIKNI